MTTTDTISITDLAMKHPDVVAWISVHSKKDEFAGSLHTRLRFKKNLTPKQLACVQKLLAPKAPGATDAVNATGMAAVQAAFDSAIESGIKRPKLRLADFILSPAPTTGKNAGAIYTFDAKELDPNDGGKLYLGKIAAGAFAPVKACTDTKRAAIVAACANPLEEAIAYGRRTGVCACCGRELTDPESIERGIGPICAGKWFGA